MPGYRKRLALPLSLLLASLIFMSWGAAVGWAAGGSCSTPSFFLTGADATPPERSLAQPLTLSIADFNHDGFLDIVTPLADFGNEPTLLNISILLGKGDGTFGPALISSPGVQRVPRGGTAGDFNNDNNLDLAITSDTFGNSIIILLGDGMGNFSLAPGSPFAVTLFPSDIVSADFNADGKLDLATSNVNGTSGGTNGAVRVMFGLGTGAFGNAQDYTMRNTPIAIAAGDLNGDSKPDLVVTDAGDQFSSVILNTCVGCVAPSFGSRADYDMGATNVSLTLDDFSGDGKLDIATSMTNRNASVLANNGSGAFASAGQFYTGAPSNNAPVNSHITGGDFNNDGKKDMAVVWDFSVYSRLSIFLNTGAGSCQTATCFGAPTIYDSTGRTPSDIATADFNRDGRPDLAISNFSTRFPTTNDIIVFLNGCARVNTVSIFDEDFKSDIAVYRPGEGNWYILNSIDNSLRVQNWGLSTDKPVPGDYDGDGKTDLAVFRPSEGNWYIIQSSNGAPTLRNWGGQNDVPVPRDYDGDGKTDVAVFRPSEGNWYILNSGGSGVTLRGWGAIGDKTVPADYDGDGRADIAIFRPSEGNWYIINSATNTVRLQNWGIGTDQPVPADYDGDSLTDIAVFRPSEGNWYIIKSTGGATLTNWGASGDRPVPGDYDGDARADVAVYRPLEGNWFIKLSLTNTVRFQFLGSQGDVPIAGTYIPQ
jgi:hypothetical protein